MAQKSKIDWISSGYKKTDMTRSARRNCEMVLYSISVRSSYDSVGEEKLSMTLLGSQARSEN